LPPLVLRMVVVANENREPVYLVTDVMNHRCHGARKTGHVRAR